MIRQCTGTDPVVVLRHQLCSDASTAPGGGRARQQSEYSAWTTGFRARDEPRFGTKPSHGRIDMSESPSDPLEI